MASPGAEEEDDLYALLSVSRTATQAEIKSAYKRAALASHPDKHPEHLRPEAEARFKAISRAHEILGDESRRAQYDEFGMAAFDGRGTGGDADMDAFAAMFAGMNGAFSGMHGSFGGHSHSFGANGTRKGRSEVQQYEVTLEELYKGKTTKFASTKNVICQTCRGSGGREGKKNKKCSTCDGKGTQTALRPIGPGLVTQETVACKTCSGRGNIFADKDKCKKCKGTCVVSQRKMLELYVPRGAREGERIVLAGEADQRPGQEPGDIVFVLQETPNDTFQRAGADLCATLDVSLAEALTGFSRQVVSHLDGRGIKLSIQQPRGKVLRPGEILRVRGEGMPVRRSEAKGDLYLIVNIKFPEDGWLKDDEAIDRVRDVLPRHDTYANGHVGDVDEVDFELVDNLDGFGADSDDPRAGDGWQDDDDDGPAQAQCQQQ